MVEGSFRFMIASRVEERVNCRQFHTYRNNHQTVKKKSATIFSMSLVETETWMHLRLRIVKAF